MIVKDDGKKLEPSKGRINELTKSLAERRERVYAIVKRYEKDQIWDAIQARDIDAELIDFVVDRFEKGQHEDQIRKDLGILRKTDKQWRKIMAALKMGVRIDGTAWLVRKSFEYQAISDKVKEQILDAFDNGVPIMNADGEYEIVKGPTKELASMIGEWNKLQQGYIKIGKDLGAFIDDTGNGKGAGGVTIVVQSNVMLPTQKEIDAEREKQREKHDVLLAQGREIKDHGQPKS